MSVPIVAYSARLRLWGLWPDLSLVESALTSHFRGLGWQIRAHSLKEADPEFAEVRLRPLVSVSSKGLVDISHHLTRPAGSGRSDPDQRPLVASDVFIAVDIGIPLMAIGAVLIALVFEINLYVR